MSTTTAPTKIYYAWVTTWNTTAGTGTDPQIYISHELLEIITDPDANTAASGWTSSTFCPAGANPCELSDQCELTTGVGNYTSLTGVNCWSSSYYSNSGGGCVIPGIINATSSANQNFVWGGGKLLQNATVCMIFAGAGTSAWTFTNSSTPTAGTADDIKRGVQTLLTNTQYYNLITQYSVNKPKFSYAALNLTTSIPNPFQDAHIQQVIKDSINAGTVPSPASNTDPIIYVVVVNNTGSTGPKYISNTTIGSHGSFMFTPAPPTNVPTTNPPGSGSTGVGPTSPSLQGDQWGITEIYPSRTTGTFSTAWFLPSNPNSDTRHVVDSTTFSAQADGSYRNTQTNVIYNIAQSNGFIEGSLSLNQTALSTQYYMQDVADWTNVEMTFFVRLNSIVNSTHSGPPNLMLAMRGAKETNDSTLLSGLPKSCEAADYRVYIEPVSGIIKLQKDLQYTAGITPVSSNPSATSPLVGLAAWQAAGFVGIKAICYNLADGKSVAIELWMDSNGANNWVQILRYVDSGNWSSVSNGCAGTVNQQINWGGPICKFIWNNISSIDIKYASIREIDVYALNPQLLTPPSTNRRTGTATVSPANNLPPNPPPPNQAPPTTAATGTLDKFGVKMIYPSISGGQSWYLSSRGLKGDSRVVGIPSWVREYINGDGSFHLSTNSNVTFFVSTNAGYSFQGAGGLIVSHLLARVRQYLFSNRDWKNVEITMFHNIEMVNKTGKSFDFGIKCRTGSHSRQRDCQGSAYEIQTLCFPGSEIFKHRKEQWHDCHADTDRTAAFSFSSPLKRWVGEKFIAYNIVDATTGHVTGVRLEHWWNDNGDGVTWTKVNTTTDIGGWGFLDALCGGDIDEKIIWGGPLIAFSWNDFTRVDYKWMSIREIDTAQQSSPPGGPPSTSPPSGPPPKPPAISPLIGPNAYNIFKFPSNVILDDTGGCGGIDPNAHLGETFLGSVPGTGNTITMRNTTGAAFLAGQQIQSTSSVLYNKVLAEYSFYLRLVGLPADSLTKPVYATIRRSPSIDGIIVVNFGQITPNNLTSQWQLVTFKTPDLPTYSLGNGDIIAIEYYGGDSSNYVQAQYDNTSGFDGTNSAAVDDIVGGSLGTITASDMAGNFYSTGQTGIAGTYNRFYNVNGQTVGGSVGIIFIGGGGVTHVAEVAALGGSGLIGKTIYEIDVWLARLGTPTGAVSVYILDSNTGNTYLFGSIDASVLPDVTGNTLTLYPFFRYSNTFTCTINTKIVVEYKNSDRGNNGVAVGYQNTIGGTAYDGGNSAMYYSSDGANYTLLQFSSGANLQTADLCLQLWTSTTPPPGTLPAGTGTVQSVYIVGTVTANPALAVYLGGIINYYNVFAGILLNDSKSQLIGKTIREIDVGLATVNGTAVGQLLVYIFNSAGQIVSVSNSIDAKDLGTAYTTFRFVFSSLTYSLKAGDRIVVAFNGVDTPGPVQPAVGVAVTSIDGFDGNHTVLTTFHATSLYPQPGAPTNGAWAGYGGSWTVYTSRDMIGVVYV